MGENRRTRQLKSDKVDRTIAFVIKALAGADKTIERLRGDKPREIVEVAALSQAVNGVRPLGRPIQIVLTRNPTMESKQSAANSKDIPTKEQGSANSADIDSLYDGIEFVEEDPSPPREDPFEWSGKGNAWDNSLWLEKHFAAGSQGERQAYQLFFELRERIGRAHSKTFENLVKGEGVLPLVQSAAEANRRLQSLLKELMAKHARHAPEKRISTNMIGASHRRKEAEQFDAGSPEEYLDALVQKCAEEWDLLQYRVDRRAAYAMQDVEWRSAGSRLEFEIYSRIARDLRKSGEEISAARARLLAGWMKICGAYWDRVIIIKKPSRHSERVRTTH